MEAGIFLALLLLRQSINSHVWLIKSCIKRTHTRTIVWRHCGRLEKNRSYICFIHESSVRLAQNKGEGKLISIAAEAKVDGVKTKNKTWKLSEVSATSTLDCWMINSRGDFLFADDEIIKKLMIVFLQAYVSVVEICWCFPSVQSASLRGKLGCLTQPTVYSDGKLRRDVPTRFVNFTFEQFIFLYSLFIMFPSTSWHWWSTQLRLTSKMGKSRENSREDVSVVFLHLTHPRKTRDLRKFNYNISKIEEVKIIFFVSARTFLVADQGYRRRFKFTAFVRF